MKKVIVEKDLCIRCGACMQIASETFGYSPEGHSEVKKDIIDENDKNVLMAVEACPTGAIRIEDSEGEKENSNCSCEHCDCNPCGCDDQCDCDGCIGN